MISHRDAEPGDIEDLVALVVASIDTYRDWRPATWAPPDPARHAAHWRGQFGARMLDSHARAIVACDGDGRLVGVIGFTQAREPDNMPIDGVGHVWVLFVAPACWRRGIAAKLLSGAQDALRERGFVRVILSTPAGAPATRFYEANGFAPDGRHGRYEPAALDLVGYTKALV